MKKLIKMFILDSKKGKSVLYNSQEIGLDDLGALNSGLAKKIVKLLVKGPNSVKNLAKSLGVHEQTVYYHVYKLEKSKIIEVKGTNLSGGFEEKLYGLKSNAFHFFISKKRSPTQSLSQDVTTFLYPFIIEGSINSLVIVGSPEPHGPEKARSKDSYFALDLAFFLGSFLNSFHASIVKLDTEVSSSDLKNNNLILIGGPIVNTITLKLNSKLPVLFNFKEKGFYSTKTGKKYFSDEVGVIIKQRNPFNRRKNIVVLEGKRYLGTKSCVVAMIKNLENVSQKINEQGYTIVKGFDKDSDGIIDTVEFLE